MGRLVDVDVARKLVDEEMYWNESKKATVRAFFRRLPTVDAVEVVRCKDCKYYRESEHPERSGIKFCFRLMHPAEDRRIGYNFSGDDFCSCGEKRE